MAIDKRLHQTLIGLADFLRGRKDTPTTTEALCLEFMSEVLPLMLDPLVADRHMRLRKVCLDFSLMWREAEHEGH